MYTTLIGTSGLIYELGVLGSLLLLGFGSTESCIVVKYTSYEGLNWANQMSRKLKAFGRKLEGSHYTFYCNFNKYYRK